MDGVGGGRRRSPRAEEGDRGWQVRGLVDGGLSPGSNGPPDPGQLGEAVGALEWYLWGDPAPDTGWSLRIAVADPARRRGWALSALDAE